MGTVISWTKDSTNTVTYPTTVTGQATSAATILVSLYNASGTAFFTNRNISGDWNTTNEQYETTYTTTDASGVPGPYFLKYDWTWGTDTYKEIVEVHIIDRALKYASYSDVINRDPQRLGPHATTSASVVNIDHIFRYCLDTEAEVDAAFDAARYLLPLTDDNALEYARLAASYGAAAKALNAWFPTRVGEYGFNGWTYHRKFDEMMGKVMSGTVRFSGQSQADTILPTSYSTENTDESLDEPWFEKDIEW